ncbi:MAG: 2-oxo acid dehydrogenase subunit E2 [Desulfobulbaceae bacterium]|nr:MAG: 2-oxo acid dehydrogenase subunit E2 [Desulfobulbaceae bacterium]
MSTNFRLPDLGEGVHEAEILAVHVAPGQSVREGEPLIEVETDKAAVEIPSPVTGTVSAVDVQKGDIAKVGQILVSFDTAQAGKPPSAPPPAENKKAAVSADRPVPASPATRRLARELGVDLKTITPTGSGGIVTGDDVRQASQAKDSQAAPAAMEQPDRTETPAVTVPPQPSPAGPDTATPLPDFSQWGPIEREPFHSIRRATAARMSASWALIPHVNCQDTVDITRLEAFRRKHREEIEQAGGRLTMTVFAMKAAATALKRFPRFNASLDPAAQEIIVKHYYHIGIAVDTEHGLMVPVIRDVDRKSIRELAVELQEATQRARERSTSREEMQGGTFTITNVGGLGGSSFSAIINHPEVAILGLGQGRMQPVVVTSDAGEQEIMPRLMMPIVLSFDHRVVDGADAVRFLRQVIELLEDPDELFIAMV